MLTELVVCTKKLFGCQARGLKCVPSGYLWQSNTSSCGHFQQLSTSRMSDSSINFTENLKHDYESYLVLNVWNRTLLAFWKLSQNHMHLPQNHMQITCITINVLWRSFSVMLFVILKSSWAYRYGFKWGRDGVMFMCAHLYDVALCVNTVRNVALGIWLVGHRCFMEISEFRSFACGDYDNSHQWRSKGWGQGALGGTFWGRHFVDQKLIFERNLKVVTLLCYIRIIFKALEVIVLLSFVFRSPRLEG